MYVYMMISNDKLELPLAVADTIRELARLVGTRENCISSAISHAKKRGYKCRYVKVAIDDE